MSRCIPLRELTNQQILRADRIGAVDSAGSYLQEVLADRVGMARAPLAGPHLLDTIEVAVDPSRGELQELN